MGHMPCICQHRCLVRLVALMIFIQLALPTIFSPVVRETMRPSLALPSDLPLLHAILPSPQCGPTKFLSCSKNPRAISLCDGAQTTSAGKTSFCGRNLVRFCQHLRRWRPRGSYPLPIWLLSWSELPRGPGKAAKYSPITSGYPSQIKCDIRLENEAICRKRIQDDQTHFTVLQGFSCQIHRNAIPLVMMGVCRDAELAS